jgi:hypothetical protein
MSNVYHEISKKEIRRQKSLNYERRATTLEVKRDNVREDTIVDNFFRLSIILYFCIITLNFLFIGFTNQLIKVNPRDIRGQAIGISLLRVKFVNDSIIHFYKLDCFLCGGTDSDYCKDINFDYTQYYIDCYVMERIIHAGFYVIIKLKHSSL